MSRAITSAYCASAASSRPAVLAPCGAKRVIPRPRVEGGQQGANVEGDDLGVGLQVLAVGACVGPADLLDVSADVSLVELELLLQQRSAARNVVPQRRWDRLDLSGLVDRAIDDGDESRQFGPLILADGGEDLVRHREVGPDEARDLVQHHLQRDHGQCRTDRGRDRRLARRSHWDQACLVHDAA
ncbi:hypothetical protein ACSHWB_38580 [Lentzea sp. HUAS TT2]|uniref:hypothetical protein n=1 Tax=Lentzea sp. HUAS TT2 TaxID=3447454 RepID=UPI003F72A39F